MISIPRVFTNFFDDEFAAQASKSRQSMLANTDIHETEKAFVMTVDLPGFKKEDLDIEVTSENLVTVSGKRQTCNKSEEAKCHLRERQTTEFSRTFRLPKEVQHGAVEASYADGVLVLTIPKSEKAVPDKVKISLK